MPIPPLVLASTAKPTRAFLPSLPGSQTKLHLSVAALACSPILPPPLLLPYHHKFLPSPHLLCQFPVPRPSLQPPEPRWNPSVFSTCLWPGFSTLWIQERHGSTKADSHGLGMGSATGSRRMRDERAGLRAGNDSCTHQQDCTARRTCKRLHQPAQCKRWHTFWMSSLALCIVHLSFTNSSQKLNPPFCGGMSAGTSHPSLYCCRDSICTQPQTSIRCNDKESWRWVSHWRGGRKREAENKGTKYVLAHQVTSPVPAVWRECRNWNHSLMCPEDRLLPTPSSKCWEWALGFLPFLPFTFHSNSDFLQVILQIDSLQVARWISWFPCSHMVWMAIKHSQSHWQPISAAALIA